MPWHNKLQSTYHLMFPIVVLFCVSIWGCGSGDQVDPVTNADSDTTPTNLTQVSNTGTPDNSVTGINNPANTAVNSINQPNTSADQTTTPTNNQVVTNPMTGNQVSPDIKLTEADLVKEPMKPVPMTAAELEAEFNLDTVPDGSPEELLKYISEITNLPFPGYAEREVQLNFAIKIYSNVLVATDKILNQQATSEIHRDAVQFKFNAYETLKSIQPEKEEQIKAERLQIAQQLATVKDPLVSIFARIFLFETMLIDFSQGQEELFQPVYEDAKAIIAAPMADKNNFGAVMNAANVFAQMGHSKEAIDLATLTRAKFTNHENEELAERAKGLDIVIIQYSILSNMMATMNGEDQGDALIANLQKLIDRVGKESLEPIDLLQNLERQMEAYNKNETAERIVNVMVENYGSHPDERVQKAIQKIAEYAKRRFNLVGNPLVLTGTNLDGSPFNWDAYRGKYVLVDFWASWCEPCLAEIPNIEENYIKYRQKGFEVVGYNLNDTRQEVDVFLKQKNLTWPTIMTDNENATGMDSPMAVQCGVDGIPFLVLVDPKGVVVEINPQGERLGELLESVLGEEAQGKPAQVTDPLQQLQNNVAPGSTGSNTPANP